MAGKGQKFQGWKQGPVGNFEVVFRLFSGSCVGPVGGPLIGFLDLFLARELSFDALPQKVEVFGFRIENAIGRSTIAACPTCLLDIRLHVGGRSSVKDPSHMGCVDAHAKRTGAGQHLQCPVLPLTLSALLFFRGQPCMVRGASNAQGLQPLPPPFAFMPRLNVNEALALLALHI